MFWSCVGLVVVPVGAFLLLLLVSGNARLVRTACWISATPMKVFGVQVGLALLVTGIFSILVLLTHSEVKRYEALLNDPQLGLANLISESVSVKTELKMKHFLQERNFWLSLTALAL